MKSDFSLPDPNTRILLINSHAYDVRLPWSQRHQPTGLLQLGAALKRRDCDVRFVDCLGWDSRQRPRRRKVGTLEVEDHSIDLWCFGGLWGHLTDQMRAYKKEGWIPDQVYVSCSMTTWWQAVQEVIQQVKLKWFPEAEVILGGVYPSLEPDHARMNTQADRIIIGSVPEARGEIPDLTLYEPMRRPLFAGIYLYRSQSVTDVEREASVAPRPPEEIAQEVADKAALGVTEFAFFDEEIRQDQRQHFVEVLQAITAQKLSKVRFITIGNISPEMIDGEVAQLMGKAGYTQVYLHCDVTHSPDGVSFDTPYEVYRDCVEALNREAGFRPRTGEVTAMLLVGNPHEEIEVVTERLIKLASIVGAVNLVQFQYSGGTAVGDMYASLISRGNGNLNLTQLNCKLYPLVRLGGTPFEYYVELTRLAALLNSKYRSKTFDFLGNGLIAQAVQQSLSTNGWNPFAQSPSEGYSEIIPLLPVQKVEHHDREE